MIPFISTFTGRKVNPLDLKVEDVCLEDIAHHLACINRFVGALKKPVSVGQHSVYVSRLLTKTDWALEGLFHDAPEAYLGDISKWIKLSDTMGAYREAEDRAWIIICDALKLRHDLAPCVKDADDLMVRFEALQGLKNPNHLFALASHPEPTDEEIERVGNWAPWPWRAAEEGFFTQYRILTNK